MSNGYLLYQGTMSDGHLLSSGTMSGGNLLSSGTMSGGSLLSSGTMSGGSLLSSGTLSGGNLLYQGTMSGGSLLYQGTMSGGSLLQFGTLSGGILLSSGTLSGGNLLYQGTMSGGSLLQFGGKIRNVKFGGGAGWIKPFTKILGGTIGSSNNKAIFDFVIFRKQFKCPAYYIDKQITLDAGTAITYKDYTQDVFGWSSHIIAQGIREGWTFNYFKEVKEGDADFASATQNTSVWNIEANNCFYEDGAMLSGIPAETRAKIRPIAEMGLPPVAAPPKVKTKIKTLAGNIPANTPIYTFYNLKPKTLYSLNLYVRLESSSVLFIRLNGKIIQNLSIQSYTEGADPISMTFSTYKNKYGTVIDSTASKFTLMIQTGSVAYQTESYARLTEEGPTEETTDFDAP